MADIFPPDPTTPVGQLRLLIADTVQRKDPENPTAKPEFYLSDAFINGFLSLNSGNLKLAAADALVSFAANEALISKKIRTEDLQTDGPAVTNALRLLAQDYRTQGNDAQNTLDAESSFTIVDFADPVTTYDLYEYSTGGLQWH